MYAGIDGVERKNNSRINMKIRGMLVSREVIANVSDMVDGLMGADVEGWNFSEFSNAAYDACPDCAGEVFPLDWEKDAEAIAEYNELTGDEIDETSVDEYMICGYCGKITGCPDHEYREPYEYYIVDESLGRDLRDAGEMVLERYWGWIWGRCSTGQAVSLDGVVGRICERMEILEGQRYSWENEVR